MYRRQTGRPWLPDDEIEALVREVLDELPSGIGRAVEGAVIHIEDFPSREILRDARNVSPNILGLYIGVPLSRQSFFGGFVFPPQIFLFRGNIARYTRNRRELRKQLRETLLHEIGHHLGMTEDELRVLEREIGRYDP